MKEIKLTVDEKGAGKRLDKFLVEILEKRLSRSFVKKLIDGRDILVNGKYAKAHHRVLSADVIEIRIPEPKLLELKPENIPLDIVYEDKDLLLINKYPGISVHPAGKNLSSTLVNALLYHCKDLSSIGGVLRPGIVHRLDKDTTGLLVIAKSDDAHRNLAGQFMNRTIKRKYIALVKGIVQLDNGKIEMPIARRKKEITKMGISFVDERKKHAVTNYKVIRRFEDFTMLELLLETGRTHQIRVHLASVGHPLIGDKLYGSSKGMNRHALHAKTLGFFHPTTRKFMEFDSEIPKDMQELINRGRL